MFDKRRDPDDLAGLIPHPDAARVVVTTTRATTTLDVSVRVGVYSVGEGRRVPDRSDEG